MHRITDELYKLTIWLESFTNWYVILLLFLLAFELVSFLMWLVTKKELTKRRNIMRELNEIKHSLLPDDYQGGNKGLLDEIFFLSTVKSKLTDEQFNEYNEKGTEIIKKYKGRPYLIILGFFVQAIVLAFFYVAFISIDALDYHYFFPVSAIIITFFGNVSKKTLVFFGILCGFLFWIYLNVNGTTVVFLFYLACFNFGKKMFKKWRAKNIKKDVIEKDEGILK